MSATDAAVTPARVLRSEWSKLCSLRSTWYTIGGAVALSLALGLIIGISYEDGGDGPADPVEVPLFGLNFAQLLLPILGILVAAGEWSTGLIRATMAAVPRRLPVLWAKAAVLGAAVFATILATALITFPLAQSFLSGTRIEAGFSDPGVARALFGSAAAVALISVIGLALGALVRSVPASIGIFVAVLMVMPGLAQLAPYAWVETAINYTPLHAAEPLVSALPKDDRISPLAGLLTLCAWVAAVLAAAAVRLRRSDV
ncbi:ABC transporter permease [Streptomyces sp. A7024]|uniref:ABC transporter permease n=1 Tax=Streptomyces coryli TaxID=1128680 RepID=A0A6G4U6U7_9ACTN|nr:ABC transporter permease subunit [Streptomyces coryli]NGN67460.1 ABC transporter permease [Streptomyces coryli]